MSTQHKISWQNKKNISIFRMKKKPHLIWSYDLILTLVLLNPDIPCLCNSVDPDQLASEEANSSGSALFAIKYMN